MLKFFRRSSLYICFFIAAFINSAHAISGKLESLTEYFPTNLGPPTSELIPRLGLELDQDQKLSKKLSYSFKGIFESNLASTEQPENYFGDLKEAYGEWKPSRTTKMIVGWNTVNWGVLDVYSPMDVVNQRTYFDPLNPDNKRGAGMVNLQWNPTGWSMSAIYIPAQAKPILPSADSRWLPRDSIQSISAYNETVLFPSSVTYDIQDPVTLNHALNNNYGLNIERHWDWLDLHAMYFNGAAATPSFVPDISNAPVVVLPPPITVVQLSNPVILHPLFYRTQTTGIGFSSTIGQVIVRGESTYQDAEVDTDNGYFYSQWSWQHGLGLEKNWEIGSHTLTTLVHYYYGTYPSVSNNLQILSGYRLFDNSGLFGFRLAITDDQYFYGSVMYNVTQQGFLWTVGYHQKLTDSLHWDISWRDISASQDGLLKTYDQNDHAVMDLSYFF